MKKIVVVGSLNMDLVAYVGRMPAEGETLPGRNFATFPGGKGANQAVAAGRLGGNVTMVGRVGMDDFAQRLRQALENDHVVIDRVLAVDQPTGTAIILVSDSGSNSIVVIPGANAELKPHDLDAGNGPFHDAAVVLSQLEIPLETVVKLGERCAQLGVPLILDPAPARALPPELLRNVTWLTPNETEVRILLESLGHQRAAEDGDFAATAGKLLATGVRNVILKMGERGVYIAGADVPGQVVLPFRVKAVDTTAAGDAFNGGFALGMTQGIEPAEAARFACAVAAVSVTRPGAQPSMPRLEEVQELMKAG